MIPKISVVLSTRQKDENYVARIKETSGVETEVLAYENNNEFSLTQIYNRGLAESLHPVVVFIHDDLVFEKGSKWGLKLWSRLMYTEYGILGKAGSTKLNTSAKWWEDASTMVGRVFHQQSHPQTGKTMKWLSEYSGNFQNNITPVVTVDGLMFAAHKEKLKKGFDENIKGFHLYDIDFCVANHLEGVKVGVVFDFEVTHKSLGETNPEWETNREQVEAKYKGMLPISVDPVLFYDEKEVKIKKQPLVSIVIPTKGKVDLLTNAVESIVEKSFYCNYEIIIADTGSTPEELEQIKTMIGEYNAVNNPTELLKVVEYDYYNYAKINNDVVKNHLNPKSELVLFCNNDIVFVNDCLSIMVDTYLKNRHTCGTVGARLHFPDNHVQHAGIYLSKQKGSNIIAAGHIGYSTAYQYNNKTYTVAGSTAALLLISKNLFTKIGGFNESYKRCFEDVELNLQALLRNCKNYICGEAVALHHESQTREEGVTPEDLGKLNHFINNYMTKLNQYIITPK